MNAEYIDRDWESLAKTYEGAIEFCQDTAKVVKHLWKIRHLPADVKYTMRALKEHFWLHVGDMRNIAYYAGPLVLDVFLFLSAILVYPFCPAWLKLGIRENGAWIFPSIVDFRIHFEKRWDQFFGRELIVLDKPYVCVGCHRESLYPSAEPGVCRYCHLDRMTAALENKIKERRTRALRSED